MFAPIFSSSRSLVIVAAALFQVIPFFFFILTTTTRLCLAPNLFSFSTSSSCVSHIANSSRLKERKKENERTWKVINLATYQSDALIVRPSIVRPSIACLSLSLSVAVFTDWPFFFSCSIWRWSILVGALSIPGPKENNKKITFQHLSRFFFLFYLIHSQTSVYYFVYFKRVRKSGLGCWRFIEGKEKVLQ